MGPSLQTGSAGQRAAGGRGAPPSLSQAWGHADQRGVILQPAFPKGLSHPSAESDKAQPGWCGGRGPSAVQGRASPRRGGRPAGRGLGHRLSFPSPLPCASVPTPPLPTALPWCARGPGGGGPDVGGARSRRPATRSPSPPSGRGPALVSSGPSQSVLRTDGGQRVLLAVTQARAVRGTSGER